MSDGSDIYAKLLGIAPGPRPPDYYQLLGVSYAEADPARLHLAARQRVALLSAERSGVDAQAAHQLLGEIATARAALTTPALKARYDQQIGNQAAAPLGPTNAPIARPPAPERGANMGSPSQGATVSMTPSLPASDYQLPPGPTERWARPVAGPPPTPELPPAPPQPVTARLVAPPPLAGRAGDTVPPPVILPPPTANSAESLPLSFPEEVAGRAVLDTPWMGASYSPRRKSPRAREESSRVALIAALVCVLLVVVVGIGAAFQWNARTRMLAEVEAIEQQRAAERQLADQRSAVKAAKTKQSSPRTRSDSGPRQEVEDSPSNPRSCEDSPPITAAAGTDKREVENMDTDAASAKVVLAESAPPTPAQVGALKKKLQEVRALVVAGKLDQAGALLESMQRDSLPVELTDAFHQEEALRHLVAGFWEAIDKSLAALRGVEELTVDGETVVVVEARAASKTIVLRIQGENRTYQVRAMPANILVALADQWFSKDDVNSAAFIGAYLALSPREADVTRGRALLKNAQTAGSEMAGIALAALDR